MFKDSEEGFKKLSAGIEERISKNSSMDKFSIQKIKEQYGESIQQFKAAVSFETEHLFDQLRARFEVVAKRVVALEGKVSHIELLLRRNRKQDR